MNHRLSAYAFATLSLIGVPGPFARAAKSDFDWLLRAQEGLSLLPPHELAEKQTEIGANTAAYLRHMRIKTWVSLAWVLSAIALAWLIFVIPAIAPHGLARQHFFAVASVGCFSWGTLGRLGWTERSYKVSTVFEELDAGIFWLLYWLGAFFGVASVVSAVV